MTQAVCLICGAMKVGAYTQCPECGSSPEGSEERAKHLMITDWVFSEEDLRGMASKIKAGEELEFAPETLARFIAYVETGKFPAAST